VLVEPVAGITYRETEETAESTLEPPLQKPSLLLYTDECVNINYQMVMSCGKQDSGSLLNSPANPLPSPKIAQNSAAGRHARIGAKALKHKRFPTLRGRFSGASLPAGKTRKPAGSRRLSDQVTSTVGVKM